MKRTITAALMIVVLYLAALCGYRLWQFVPGEVARYREVWNTHEELVREGQLRGEPTLWQLLTFR